MGRLLVLLVAGFLLLSACGGEIKPPKQMPEGYNVAEGDRVAIALPPAWTATQPTAEDFRALADRFRQSNPFLAERIESTADEIKDDTLRLAAFHSDGVTTMNIAAEGVPFFQTTHRQAADTRQGLKEIGYQVIAEESVKLNGREAVRLDAEITLTSADGTSFSMTLQHGLRGTHTSREPTITALVWRLP